MKKIAFILLNFISIAVYGQKNVLHDAAFWRTNPDINAIKAEIEKGSNPAAEGPFGSDATVYAINAAANLETVKFMLSQTGNDVNKIVSNGRTYLYSAASKGNTELMEYLISKGAKSNVKDNFGYTVLTYAAATGQINTKVYDICIQHGADPKKEKITGGANALLLLAPYDKDFSVISYFVSKGVDIKSTDSIGQTAFDYAVRSGNISVLKALVAKGVKYKPDAMVTASIGYRAGTAATLQLYQYLEELKLSPKTANTNGDNVLHYIVRRPKQQELINYFIAKGVDINQANNDGTTAFMNAAGTNTDLETINLLLPLVKNINQVNKKGVSALALAVRRNSPEIVKLLIEKGADVKVVDAEGYNLTYYLVPGFAQRPEYFEAKLKLLQDKGFDITAPQGNGFSLYHMVLVRNGIPLLKRIESFKVDVNAKDKEGLTPLHKAAMTAKDDTILKYLISIGAKKDLTTEFKETAYDLAKENEYLTKQKTSIDFLK